MRVSSSKHLDQGSKGLDWSLGSVGGGIGSFGKIGQPKTVQVAGCAGLFLLHPGGMVRGVREGHQGKAKKRS